MKVFRPLIFIFLSLLMLTSMSYGAGFRKGQIVKVYSHHGSYTAKVLTWNHRHYKVLPLNGARARWVSPNTMRPSAVRKGNHKIGFVKNQRVWVLTQGGRYHARILGWKGRKYLVRYTRTGTTAWVSPHYLRKAS